MVYSLPTVPDNKKQFFRNKLLREVSNLFKWEGDLEKYIPLDYLEYYTIVHGRVMLFDNEEYGYLALPCTGYGFDPYGRITQAQSIALGDKTPMGVHKRNVVRETPPEGVTDVCVVLDNMLFGESLTSIIDFYAERMAMTWQTMDTNILWQNLPPIIQVDGDDTRLSIEKLLNDIWKGKPAIVVDKMMKLDSDNIKTQVFDVPPLFNELYKQFQQIYSSFKEDVGINALGTVKESGVTTEEATANAQGTQTALQIMLGQRQRFCEQLKDVYGLNVTVSVIGQEGGEENGDSNGGTEDTDEGEEL